MARAGVWGHEQNYTAKVRKPPTPQPELFSLEEEPGGGLPAPLSEVAGRQEKVMRHVLEDLGSVCPVVQILYLPVPHMMDQLAELLNLEEDVLDAGRLEVPKISLDVIPFRTLVPEPQLAEQLVEVPTIVSFSSLQRIMDQTVDIPVPQGGGRHADLQGFLRGQNSTGVEQIVDIPDGVLHRPGQSSSSADGLGKGVFRTFPQNKKSAELGSHSGSELLPESSPSTPAAQLKEEMEVLFAVPLQLRTPAQRARLRELVIASSQARRRKRKKRRKRRTPRTSSLPGRACRRQRQWSACNAGFTGDEAPRVHVPFRRRQAQGAPYPGRYGPEGLLQWPLQGWFSWLHYTSCFALEYGKAVIAGDPAPRAVSSFRLAHDARHYGRQARKDSRLISWLSPYSAQCLVRHWIHAVWYVAPGLEREAQPDVRVHSSSCGAHRDVVHSPFGWLYHRCHYNCRDLVLFVGTLFGFAAPLCCGSVCVAMSCGGGFFSPGGAYDSVWDSVKPMDIPHQLFPVPRGRWGVYAC